MSLLSRVSTSCRPAGFAAVVVAAAILVFPGPAARAVDGNYASPYASQYDTRSTGASIPDITWLGLLLLVVNITAASGFALRSRRRRQA